MALPKKQPDKYENVDHRRFDTIPNMTRAELVEMGELAYARGDTEARQVWQEAAMDHAKQEELVESRKRMKDILTPKAMPPSGRIMEVAPDVPWAQDPEYLKLAAKHAEAHKAVEDFRGDESGFLKLRNAVADAADAVKDRENEIKADLSASGAFTEQDQRVLDAQAEMARKGAEVAAQVSSG